MRKIVVFILLFAVGWAIIEQFTQNQIIKNADKNMTKIAEEINQKLPQSNDVMRIESVEYSDHILRYSGALLDGQQLDQEFKSTAQRKLKEFYCSKPAFINAKVSLEYSFRKFGMKGLNEKMSTENWSAIAHPQDCK